MLRRFGTGAAGIDLALTCGSEATGVEALSVFMAAKTCVAGLGSIALLLLLHRLGVPITGVAFAVSIAIDPVYDRT